MGAAMWTSCAGRIYRGLTVAGVVITMLCAWTLAAQASQRYALLIGNQTYADAVGTLGNPHNDIARVGAALKSLGFKVTLVRDADFARLHKAIKKHTSQLSRAGPDAIGFFYYSGHGAAHATSGTNYLIPTDVVSIADEDLWDNSVRLTRIIDELRQRAGNATHFVVFDACRNTLKLSQTGSKTLVQAKGFVRERRVPGMLIAYATAEGDVASDIGRGVGPYAKILAEELVRPGIEAVSVFRNVQLRMSEVTKQWPWLDLAPMPRVYLAGRQHKPARPGAPSFQQHAEIVFWNTVKDSGHPGYVQNYLDKYPNGTFAPLAKALIKRLKQEQKTARHAALSKSRPGRPAVVPGAEQLPSDPKQLAELLQTELKRVGCYSGRIDGDWGSGSKAALQAFNQHARKAFPTSSPSAPPIIELRKTFARICPQTRTPGSIAARPSGAPRPSPKTRAQERRKTSGKIASKTCRAKCAGFYVRCKNRASTGQGWNRKINICAERTARCKRTC